MPPAGAQDSFPRWPAIRAAFKAEMNQSRLWRSLSFRCQPKTEAGENCHAAEKSRRPGRLASAEEFGPPAKYAPTAHWIKPVSLSYHRPPALPAGFSFPANATIELLVDYIDSGGTGKPAVAY